MTSTLPPTGHLDAATVRRFGAREMDRVALFDTAWHLFVCSRCRALLAEAGPEAESLFAAMFGELGQAAAPVAGDLDRELDGAATPEGRESDDGGEPDSDADADTVRPVPGVGALVDRLAEQLRQAGLAIERERELAPLLYQELVGRPLTRQISMVDAESRFHIYGLAEHLLVECRLGWSDEPGVAEGQAELALAVVSRLDPVSHGEVLLNDVKAEAWSYIANCRRIRAELSQVGVAFEMAEELRAQGSGDPIEEAALLDLKASYLRDHHQYDEAAETLDRAIDLYREASDHHRAGRALIKKAILVRMDGRTEEAIELLETAAEQVDPEREPHLQFLLRKNLALYLSEVGREDEAGAMLPALRRLARDHVGRLELARLRWAEGLIYRRLGHQSWAEVALRRARDGFVEQGIGYDAALVSLDLASLYLDSGRQSEARHLAAEMIPVFYARDVHREAIVAMAIFARAAWEERITRELVHQVIGYLHAARDNPALRFEPPAGAPGGTNATKGRARERSARSSGSPRSPDDPSDSTPSER